MRSATTTILLFILSHTISAQQAVQTVIKYAEEGDTCIFTVRNVSALSPCAEVAFRVKADSGDHEWDRGWKRLYSAEWTLVSKSTPACIRITPAAINAEPCRPTAKERKRNSLRE